MSQSGFYKYLSLVKLIVGLLILFIDYVAINVFEDPVVAIGILLVGSFLTARGLSFFFFLFIQKLFKNTQGTPESESYKLSFLFGMYALLNIVLIFLGQWNKLRGLVLLGGFILLLYFLMVDSSKHVKKSE